MGLFFIIMWSGVDHSIRLKELQAINGALRKGDERLGFLFLFQKNFFWVTTGGCDNSTHFQRKFFFKGLE